MNLVKSPCLQLLMQNVKADLLSLGSISAPPASFLLSRLADDRSALQQYLQASLNFSTMLWCRLPKEVMREQGLLSLLMISSEGQPTIMYLPKLSTLRFCLTQALSASNSTRLQSASICWMAVIFHSTTSSELALQLRRTDSTSMGPTQRSSRQLKAYLVWLWRGNSGEIWWVPRNRQFTSCPLYRLKMCSPPGWMKFSSMQYILLSRIMYRTPSSLQSGKFSLLLLILFKICNNCFQCLDVCLSGNFSIMERV